MRGDSYPPKREKKIDFSTYGYYEADGCSILSLIELKW